MMKMKMCPTCPNDIPATYLEGQSCAMCLRFGTREVRMRVGKGRRAGDLLVLNGGAIPASSSEEVRMERVRAKFVLELAEAMQAVSTVGL